MVRNILSSGKDYYSSGKVSDAAARQLWTVIKPWDAPDATVIRCQFHRIILVATCCFLLSATLYLFLPFDSTLDYDRVPPSLITSTPFVPTEAQKIPSYLHYIWGLGPNHSFTFISYLTFSSALHFLSPQTIYIHYVHPPKGWWWDQWQVKVLEHRTTQLVMVKERDVTSIYGNRVMHFAHKADVLRLEALKYYGGIYLDTDVLVLRGQ